jgi:hypothetical protein
MQQRNSSYCFGTEHVWYIYFMRPNRAFFAISLLLFACSSLMAQQKGIDTQTQKIKEESNKVTSRPNDVSRSINWGPGKTVVREPLANPYKFTARKDALVAQIVEALQERRIVVDEAASRLKDGFIVTQPFVFAKGSVITQNQLGRYAQLETTDSAWSRAQYTLTIEVQPINAMQNNVSVTAKVEGRAGNGLTSEWRDVTSSGLAEDEFLAKLVEIVTGVSPDPVQEQP